MGCPENQNSAPHHPGLTSGAWGAQQQNPLRGGCKIVWQTIFITLASICKGYEAGVAGQLTGGLSVIPNTYDEGTNMTEISLWADILQDEDSPPKPAHSHQVTSVIQQRCCHQRLLSRMRGGQWPVEPQEEQLPDRAALPGVSTSVHSDLCWAEV